MFLLLEEHSESALIFIHIKNSVHLLKSCLKTIRSRERTPHELQSQETEEFTGCRAGCVKIFESEGLQKLSKVKVQY